MHGGSSLRFCCGRTSSARSTSRLWLTSSRTTNQIKLLIDGGLDIGLPHAHKSERYQQKSEDVLTPMEQAYPERDCSVDAGAH
jgi:hypothetical protein